MKTLLDTKKRINRTVELIALLLFMFCVPSYAQNVTISPQSGKLIAGL
mgnify:CR=1 FL=1